MMGTYVRVQDGQVAEVIDTGELSIDEMFHPDFVETLVDVSAVKPSPVEGMTATQSGKGWALTEYSPPPPSAAEILAANTAERDRLLASATLAIAPLQDAVDLDEATTDETAMLKKWKEYRITVNRVDLTVAGPNWPIPPA